MAYFLYCTTEAEIKTEYKSLAFKCHPDHGGTTYMFQDLQQQYEYSMKKIRRGNISPSYKEMQEASNRQRQNKWVQEDNYSWTKEIYTEYKWTVISKIKELVDESGNIRFFVKHNERKFVDCHWITIKLTSDHKRLLEITIKLAALKGYFTY